VNSIKDLGEKIEDVCLVQKILISLPNRFNPKVSAIEELNDLKTFVSTRICSQKRHASP
jgi:hypothetical protein